MNAIDGVIVALLVVATFGGFRQGFILQIATILGALAALVVARNEYLDVRHMLAGVAPQSRWLTIIAYLLVFLLVWAAIILIARRLRGLARLLMLGWIDRAGGAVIGVLQGVLLVELVIELGLRIPNHEIHHTIRHAALEPAFRNILPYISKLFPHVTY